MKTVNKVFLVLFFSISNLYAQSNEEVVYLLFDKTSKEKCKTEISYSQDNDGKRDGLIDVKKYRKTEEKKRTVFYICDEEFGFANNEVIDTLSSFKNLDIKDINYLKEKYQKANELKHHVFQKVFILEKISEKKILKYDVYWCCEWSIDD